MKNNKIAKMSTMADRESYEDHDTLTDYLAHQLRLGSVAICLGAGASMGFGLPSWKELVGLLFKKAKRKMPPNMPLDRASELILNKEFKNDRLAFADEVRNCLYKKASLEFNNLRKNDLLAALGALTMASSRGSVAKIVSFNFDDIVAKYLSYFGYDVITVVDVPSWSRGADVQILYHHGLCPSDHKQSISRPLVFTRGDYDNVVGNDKDTWHRTIVDLFTTHTCLFIGLSGEDANLTSLMTKAGKSHAKSRTGELYWGVRYGSKKDTFKQSWEDRGVYHRCVDDYSEIPGLLFEICQRAAAISKNSL